RYRALTNRNREFPEMLSRYCIRRVFLVMREAELISKQGMKAQRKSMTCQYTLAGSIEVKHCLPATDYAPGDLRRNLYRLK
ncbi:hypothetical protein ACCT30_40200, partial [Rhizobium ruizarguesonis]